MKRANVINSVLLLVLLVFMASVTSVLAEVPNLISYQGILADQTEELVPDGEYDLVFILYMVEVGGAAIWQENHTNVFVHEGRFNVLLGKDGGLDNLAFDAPYWLGISVEGSSELPRMQLTSAAFSLNAKNVTPDAIDSSKIRAAGISFSDIGQNGATTGQAMKWNGSHWVAANDETGGGGDNYWTLIDSVIYLRNILGLAKGGEKNKLWGLTAATHVNLGIRCTTGVEGFNWPSATVSGGKENAACLDGSTVGGGVSNRASSSYTTVSGGQTNLASGYASTVSGGKENTAYGYGSTVGGGFLNNANGKWSSVPSQRYLA